MDVLLILGWNWGPLDPRWDALRTYVVSILIAGIFLVSLVRISYHKEVDPGSLFSLGLMGAIPILILLSFPIFLWGALRGAGLNFRAIFLTLTVGLGIGILILTLRSPRPRTGSVRTLLGLVFLLCGLSLVRLAFIRDLPLPPYSDSVEHYQIVNDLLHPERAPAAFYSLARLTSRYYHFGFHALAGWVGALSNAPASQVLLILGQILQAMIPVSLFFLVKAITSSDSAGLFSVVLAGLGWRMPAFASNWGKYPALTGIVTFLFALSLLALAGSAEGRKERLSLLALALAGGIVSTLTHTRSLLLLVMALGSWWITGRVREAGRGWSIFVIVTFASLALWAGIQISQTPALTFMLEPYLHAGFLPTLLVALLLPYGLKYFPRQMVSALLFLLFLVIFTFVPLPAALERFGYQSLLDRPFGQMVLFLPLALIGGIGLAGLGRVLNGDQTGAKLNGLRRRLWIPASVLLCLAVTTHAFRHYDFSPSSCCQLAADDDLAAFDWIEGNLPKDVVILIASNRTPSRSFGVDGGIWISPLTGYRTEKWPYNAAMDSPVVLEQICAKGATHIYAGGTTARFSVETIESQPEWYENLFTRPGAYVYEIIGCSAAPE